ncbi:hypothetical protein ACFL9T_09585 [Thermodesulfobacteriota bacterium]
MDDYSRLGGMQPAADMPGRVWKIQKKRKTTERKQRRNKHKGKEAAGKDTLREKDKQIKTNDDPEMEQELDIQTPYGSTPLKPKTHGKIDLII